MYSSYALVCDGVLGVNRVCKVEWFKITNDTELTRFTHFPERLGFAAEPYFYLSTGLRSGMPGTVLPFWGLKVIKSYQGLYSKIDFDEIINHIYTYRQLKQHDFDEIKQNWINEYRNCKKTLHKQNRYYCSDPYFNPPTYDVYKVELLTAGSQMPKYEYYHHRNDLPNFFEFEQIQLKVSEEVARKQFNPYKPGAFTGQIGKYASFSQLFNVKSAILPDGIYGVVERNQRVDRVIVQDSLSSPDDGKYDAVNLEGVSQCLQGGLCSIDKINDEFKIFPGSKASDLWYIKPYYSWEGNYQGEVSNKCPSLENALLKQANFLEPIKPGLNKSYSFKSNIIPEHLHDFLVRGGGFAAMLRSYQFGLGVWMAKNNTPAEKYAEVFVRECFSKLPESKTKYVFVANEVESLEIFNQPVEHYNSINSKIRFLNLDGK